MVDHLATRREVTLQRLQDRPPEEPPLVSLHTVLRELAESGFDRRLLAQIRAVLTTEPRLGGDDVSLGSFQFELKLADVLHRRAGGTWSAAEIKAVTVMAASWFTAAVHLYFVEGRPSLVACFDEVVASCLRAVGETRLTP